MESFMQVFNLVKNACHEGISDVAFNLWISPLEPVKLENDTAYLFIKSEFQKNIILDKYFKLLSKSFNQVLGFDVKIEILTESADQQKKGEKNLVELDSKTVSDSMPNGDYEYTFDTFIVGSSNNFAVAASRAVASRQSGSYNPLFIYGGVGLGKTHLMHSIAHFILKNDPKAKILYVTSEKFTNELIDAIRNKNNITTTEFREKYRNNDVLLIDDIQFIIGKESTQEEFFHTFNTLYESKKQIIISSDKPPKEIETLEERLRSRFEWGLTVDIQSPDYETRMAILRKKEELEGYNIDNEVIKYIATNIKSNIRELEGALTKIVALSKLETNKEITIELAEEALKDLISSSAAREITPEYIIQIVCDHFQITPLDIASQKRNRDIVLPRQIAMYLCRDMTAVPLQTIGKSLGGRDHTTVLHGADKISHEILKNDSLQNTIEILKKKISPQ